MNFHIITLFPEAFDSYLKTSILGRAIQNKKISVTFYNPRLFTKDKHRRVDGKPYGGGPGMVIEAEPVLKAVTKAIGRKKKVKIIFLSPAGVQFDSLYSRKLTKRYKDVVIISGHYEGVDARVATILKAEHISIGPYVLTGGELPAMAIIDSLSRNIKGVLGNIDSLEEKRTASFDVYTRPEILEYKKKKYKVPKVLLSGNHREIEKWRKNKKK
ncbi:tRNA (guanosine(37)-N1)-methyltransferase TrmD [Patescibacteria group bacterium]|nr:tRNA (guanosine(37)-N1)-methyltransferase TrmD [Patescibacteria group bacterium]